MIPSSVQILCGDALTYLSLRPDESIQCCVTSPPYFGLRDYGVEGQIGLEETPQEYIANLVGIFQEVRRMLKSDGTLWLNLGDSYAGSWGAQSRPNGGVGNLQGASMLSARQIKAHPKGQTNTGSLKNTPGMKSKDLMMLPQRVAMALQVDGWYLRSQIPWVKRNTMPESVTDRPTSAIEYIFLLTKSEKYYYDHQAVMMPVAHSSEGRLAQNIEGQVGTERANGGAKTNGNFKAVCSVKGRGGKNAFRGQGHFREGETGPANRDGRDMRDVGASLARNRRNSDWFWQTWQGMMTDETGDPLALVVNPKPYRGAHFATFPPKLVEPCVLAGSRPDDIVLDPFGGSGTVAQVASEHGRKSLLIELNPKYVELIHERLDPI